MPKPPVVIQIISYGAAFRERDGDDFAGAHIVVDLMCLDRETWGDEDAEKIIELGRLAKKAKGREGSGMSWRIRRVLQMNPGYVRPMSWALNLLVELADKPVPVITVVVNCKYGKHRSVGFAMDLEHEILSWQKKGGPAVEVRCVHLEQPRWDRDLRLALGIKGPNGLPWPMTMKQLEQFNLVALDTSRGTLYKHVA